MPALAPCFHSFGAVGAEGGEESGGVWLSVCLEGADREFGLHPAAIVVDAFAQGADAHRWPGRPLGSSSGEGWLRVAGGGGGGVGEGVLLAHGWRG